MGFFCRKANNMNSHLTPDLERSDDNFFGKLEKLIILAILDPFCSVLGKSEFSQKSGFCPNFKFYDCLPLYKKIRK